MSSYISANAETKLYSKSGWAISVQDLGTVRWSSVRYTVVQLGHKPYSQNSPIWIFLLFSIWYTKWHIFLNSWQLANFMLALILKTIILMEGNSQPNFLTHHQFKLLSCHLSGHITFSTFFIYFLTSNPFCKFPLWPWPWSCWPSP